MKARLFYDGGPERAPQVFEWDSPHESLLDKAMDWAWFAIASAMAVTPAAAIIGGCLGLL